MSLSSRFKEIIELNELKSHPLDDENSLNSPNNSNNSNNSHKNQNNFHNYSQIDNNLEMGSIHSSSQRSSAFTITRSYPWNNNNSNNNNISNVPRTILSSTPVKDSPEYIKAIQKERYILLTILGIVILFGPLVFRFCLGCPTSKTKEPTWGGDLDSWEIYILLTLFSSMTGSIIRLLPALCGSPATINSVKNIKLEGNAALCLVSPFCAEGDEMLLRSMLGRTCTLFHTIGSRHTLNGLYVDVTMNERRLKGEATRKNIYYEWMGFLTTLIKISQKNYNEKKTLSPILSQSGPDSPIINPPVLENKYAHETNFKNRFQSFRNYGESVFDLGRNSNVHDYVPTIVIDSRDSIQLRRTTVRKSTVGSAQLFRPVSGLPQNYPRTQSSSTTTSDERSVMSHLTNGSVKSQNTKHVTIDIPTENEPETFKERQREIKFAYHDDDNSFFETLQNDDRDVTNRSVLNGLSFDLESVEPVINFFDQWLAEMKLNERIYHYGDKNESLDRLFLAAPFMDHFEGEDLLAVHTALDRLYVAFTTNLPDDADSKLPIYPDDIQEIEWTVKRKNAPSWSVIWSHIGRSKLRPMSQAEIGDTTYPPPLFDVVKITPGAIVYCNNKLDGHPAHGVESFLSQRKKTYKVLTIRHENGKRVCDLTPFPPSPTATDIVWELEELYLLEMNRGKAGALNFCNEYFRRKTLYWTTKIHMTQQIQALVGIVDARHALVQPEVFWNDALPFFSSQKDSLAPSRSYGFGELHKFPVCITVQYPQFFSNVGDNDWLDNANSAYYNLWQPLRDCGKCVTSSGTNTIWDISDPNFIFCTDSRSEDLGTSHKYIPDSVAVYLCSYVAFGIAKKTEDYLEALYRWSAGPLELMWLSLFEPFMLWNYFIVMVPSLLLALASFSASYIWYYIYLVMIGMFGMIAIYDKIQKRKPLRKFVVATVICSNLWGWVGCAFSLTWVFILPLRVAVFGEVPFLEGQRWFFWGLATLVFGFPMALFNDAMVRVARLSSPDARKLNLYKALWRGSQLYACSFAYASMSILAGTYSAFKAWWYKRDLSLWSSFRVSGNEMDKAWNKVVKSKGFDIFSNFFSYCILKLKYLISLTTNPTEMTRLYVTTLFICQVVFVVLGVTVTNAHNYVGAIVIISGSCINMALIYQVAFLLQPNLKFLGGFPVRTELLYSFVGIAMVLSAAVNQIMTIEEFLDALQIRPSIKHLND